MDANKFLRGILREFYRRMPAVVADNYDAGRFGYDGVDRSGTVEIGPLASYLAFFVREHPRFFETWRLLADQPSRDLFVNLILYRLLGHTRVQIREGFGGTYETSLFRGADTWLKGDSDLPIRGAFGGLKAYRGVPFEGRKLDVDCWPGGVVYTYLKRQYLYARAGVSIRPEAGDTILDLGACLGDTTVGFATIAGPSGRVHAFDPLPAHVRATGFNLAQNGLEALAIVVPRAVSDRSNDLPPIMADDGVVNPGFVANGDGMPTVSIDDYVKSEGVRRVDFIKADIEGAELAALRGAAETLKRDRPKLAISLYHRAEDYLTIPQWLAATLPDYEFHLDHYTIHAEETVLFGRPRA